MKLAIVTAGAVGSYLGGLFVGKGAEITFVARGNHLKALQETALTITKPGGDLFIRPDQYQATENSAEAVREVDMVLLTK